MIQPELAHQLNALERFESIRRRSVWRGDRVADLSYANPYAGVAAATRTAIRAALDAERTLDLQYTPFGGHVAYRRSVADALGGSHNLPFAMDDVVLTPGATPAVQLALRAVGEPGDEVIVPVPCWMDFPLYIQFAERVPVLVPLAPHSFDLDIEAIRRAIGPRTCAILFSTPSNPAGRAYDTHKLNALAQLLGDVQARSARTISVISDEVHRDFADASTFASIALAWPSTLLVYSFGKYHFLQGQKLGYLAVSPQHPDAVSLRVELPRWARITGTGAPNSLMQRAIPALLRLRHDFTWLEAWRERFEHELRFLGYETAATRDSLFLYVRTPPGEDDFQFIERLGLQGVLALPAPVFHHAGWFRLSLTGSEKMLQLALGAFHDLERA